MANKQRQLAASSTAEVTEQVAFSIPEVLTRGGKSPIVSVEGLGEGETLSFYVRVGGSWKELLNAAGEQVVFTADYSADTFNTDGVFGYLKDATVAPIKLLINDSR